MRDQSSTRWPGHIPGRFYFGMTRLVPAQRFGTHCTDASHCVESYGVHRFSVPWESWDLALETISEDHALRRLPWVSVRPPLPGLAGWREISSGHGDESIYRLGQRLGREVGLPAIVTFDMDPSDAASDASGPVWADAYCRFQDIVVASTDRRLVAEAPIICDWLFNPSNHRQSPDRWLTDAVLERSSILGANVYVNSSGETFERRIPRILDWLADRGFENLMIGVAGSGHTEYAPPHLSPETWLTESLDWTAKNTDHVGVVCYNSSAREPSVFWSPEQLGRPGRQTSSWASRAITHC